MNENQNTEQEPKAADNKKKPVFLAPISQRGKKGTVGAPAKPIIGLTKNPCRGKFTIDGILQMNGGTVSRLTIINCLHGTETRKGMIELGEVEKVGKEKKDGKPGKPADLFAIVKYMGKKNSKSKKGNKPNTKELQTVAVETAPVVDLNPAPVTETEAVPV